MNKNSRAKTTAICGVLACLALIFSYIEFLFPLSLGVPGIKLGIANLVVVIILYYLGAGYAFSVNLVRVLLSGLLFSGMFGALYSLGGALLSFAVMLVLKKTNLFSMVGVSMAGGVAHNLGQILVASVIISNTAIFAYFPVLIFSGIAGGIIIGIIATLIYRRLPEKA